MGRVLQVICGVVLAAALLPLRGEHPEPKRQQQSTAHSERRDVAPTRTREDNPEAPKHPTESERQYRDLTAQEEMARAAGVQAAEVRLQTWLVAVSVALGGLALIVSGAALNTAIGSGRRQLRAYVHIEMVHIDWERADSEGTCRLIIDAHNTGETPAVRFSTGYSALRLVSVGEVIGCDIPPDNELKWEHWSSLGGNSTRGNVVYPENHMGIDLSELHDQPHDKRMLFTGRVYYTDVYGKIWFSEFAAQYHPKWPIDRSELAFVTANVRAYAPARGGYPD